jgi:hypothetical protein
MRAAHARYVQENAAISQNRRYPLRPQCDRPIMRNKLLQIKLIFAATFTVSSARQRLRVIHGLRTGLNCEQ